MGRVEEVVANMYGREGSTFAITCAKKVNQRNAAATRTTGQPPPAAAETGHNWSTRRSTQTRCTSMKINNNDVNGGGVLPPCSADVLSTSSNDVLPPLLMTC